MLERPLDRSVLNVALCTERLLSCVVFRLLRSGVKPQGNQVPVFALSQKCHLAAKKTPVKLDCAVATAVYVKTLFNPGEVLSIAPELWP